jgi:hypothetical protein
VEEKKQYRPIITLDRAEIIIGLVESCPWCILGVGDDWLMVTVEERQDRHQPYLCIDFWPGRRVQAGYGVVTCPDGKDRRVRSHYTIELEGELAGRARALWERALAYDLPGLFARMRQVELELYQAQEEGRPDTEERRSLAELLAQESLACGKDIDFEMDYHGLDTADMPDSFVKPADEDDLW